MCELRDHGEPAGAEVQLLKNGEFYAGRRFDTRDLEVQHGDHVRESLERDGWRSTRRVPISHKDGIWIGMQLFGRGVF